MPFKILSCIFGFLFLCQQSETETPVRICPGQHPLPLTVQINNCTESPCVLLAGVTIHATVQFVATKDNTHHVYSHVAVTVSGKSIEYLWPSGVSDVCMNLMYGAYCPLYAGEDVTYRVIVPTIFNTQDRKVKVEMKLMDLNNDVMACFVSDLQIRRHTRPIYNKLFSSKKWSEVLT